MNIGKFTIEANRNNAPIMIEKLNKLLPINSRGIKRGNKIIFNLDLKTGSEKGRELFEKGDLSFEPSSGNVTIYLDKTSSSLQNYIGTIKENLDKLDRMQLSIGITLKKI